MSELNDENTRLNARCAHDQVSTFLAHFYDADASWESFGKADGYLERLKLYLDELSRCVEAELQARAAVEPTDFGT